MTKEEYRQSKEYAECYAKIKGYPQGFRFTIPYRKMTQGVKNAMVILLTDCQRDGLIESVAMGYSIDDMINGDIGEETFKRL